MDRLAAAVTARGMSILARIDHAAAAAAVGMTLRPTAVLIFGSPQATRSSTMMAASFFSARRSSPNL